MIIEPPKTIEMTNGERGLASWFIIIGMALAFALYWIGRLLIYLWNHIEWIE